MIHNECIYRKTFWVAFILCLLHYTSPSLAQNPHTDSLRNSYISQSLTTEKLETLVLLWEAIAYTVADSGFEYARRGIHLSRQIREKGYEAKFLHRLGVSHQVASESDSAIYYYELAIPLYEEVGEDKLAWVVKSNIGLLHFEKGDNESFHRINGESMDWFRNAKEFRNLAFAHTLEGNAYLQQGKYTLAAKHNLKALEIYKTIDVGSRYVADVENNLAAIAFYQGKREEAISLYHSAIANYKKADDKFYMSQSFNDLGNNYEALGRLDSAEFYLQQSNELSESIGFKQIQYISLGNLAKVYVGQNAYQKAIPLFETALKELQKLGGGRKVAEQHLNLACAYRDLKKIEEGLFHIDSSIYLSHQLADMNVEAQSHAVRAELLEHQGALKEALAAYQTYIELKDSVLNAQSNTSLAEMLALYDLGKKEEQIGFLEERLAWNKTRTLGITIGLLLAILTGLSLIMALTIKIRKDRKIREQEQVVEATKIENLNLERARLSDQLEYRNRELAAQALHICQKNELLSQVKSQLDETKVSAAGGQELATISRNINQNLKNDKEWDTFMDSFTEVHPDFLPKLKSEFPKVSPNECRLAALYKLNLASKDIAQLLHISPDSVKKARTRLRKKLGLEATQNLVDFLIAFPA